MNKNLEETYYFNFNNQIIQDFLHKNLGNAKDEIGKAVAIYYAVRDLIKYDPYHIILKKEHLQASETAKRGYGYCVEKASLLTTLARAVGIPAKIGFANVKNHINSKRLYNLMKTDVFVYHGYTEMYLDGKWIKCTPAFNKSLCDRAGILTLEFNGKENSMFHPIDTKGQKHMEYLHDFGSYDDLPFEQIVDAYDKAYPHLYVKSTGTFGNLINLKEADFSIEASAD